MVADKVDLGTAPMTLSLFWPLLKNRTVGMLLIPYLEATLGLVSVLSFKHTILPAYSCANSLITGSIIRHGPHHGAQNSTSTVFSLPTTISSQLDSVTSFTANPIPFQSDSFPKPHNFNKKKLCNSTNRRPRRHEPCRRQGSIFCF